MCYALPAIEIDPYFVVKVIAWHPLWCPISVVRTGDRAIYIFDHISYGRSQGESAI